MIRSDNGESWISMSTELDAVKSRSALVEEIDFVVQQILELASGQREKQAYIGQLNELRPYLLEATVDLMKSRGSAALVLSQIRNLCLKWIPQWFRARFTN